MWMMPLHLHVNQKSDYDMMIVYMRVLSMIIFKGQNSIILICSIMKELTFPRFIYHNSAAESLLFTGKTALLMKHSFFSKMAGDRGISLVCFFFEVEVTTRRKHLCQKSDTPYLVVFLYNILLA